MSTCELLKDYLMPIAAILGPVISVVGWFVVSRQSDRREQRKDICTNIRASISDLRNLVLEIERRAFEYYRLSADKSHDAGTLLKQQLQHVAGIATSITHQNAKFDTSESLRKLRQTITGGDFESCVREPRTSTDPRMTEILQAAQEFLDDLDRIFGKEYSP